MLEISNNLRTFLAVTYPKSWDFLNDPWPKFGPGIVARYLSTTEAKLLGSDTATARVVDGGATLTLRVPDGSAGIVSGEFSSMAWFAEAVTFGLDVYAQTAKLARARSPIDQSPLSAESRQAWLSYFAEQRGDWGAATRACTSAASDIYNESVENEDIGAKTWEVLITKCVPAMFGAQSEIAHEAAYALAWQAAAGLAASALTAVRLVVTGTRQGWDGITALRERRSLKQGVRLRRNATATDMSRWEAADFASPSGGLLPLIRDRTVLSQAFCALGEQSNESRRVT